MWKKPTCGMVKVNVDASFHMDTFSRASGVVVRDDKGDVIPAANWFIPHVRDADAAELLAIRNGIYLLSSIGCTKARLNLVVLLWWDPYNYMSPVSAVIVECKQLSIDFAKLSFGHYFREANQVPID
ncbi:Bidirectional sugar transporter SWEET14 [Hordeum vulgare]|nr:Bidirectional sugar transporter SWEET14 [Hordeum vulgare]